MIQVSKLTNAKLMRIFQRKFRDSKTMTNKIRELRRVDRQVRRMKRTLKRL